MTIELEIYGRNLEVTDRVKTYITKKVSKLDRYLPGIEDARVDLVYAKSARSAADRHVAEITVYGKGFILRTEERSDDILIAIDQAVDKMQRQIERYKGKHYRGRGNGKSAAEVLPPAPEEMTTEEETGELIPAVVRRKRFILAPMNEMEAIEQMSLLGHESFFVFYNANTHAINVLYRRRDGMFGLIEPEVG
jgi:putative sigma-54 modulation protein